MKKPKYCNVYYTLCSALVSKLNLVDELIQRSKCLAGIAILIRKACTIVTVAVWWTVLYFNATGACCSCELHVFVGVLLVRDCERYAEQAKKEEDCGETGHGIKLVEGKRQPTENECMQSWNPHLRVSYKYCLDGHLKFRGNANCVW